MMVQIPDTFDPSNACIITAPSSGSRGVYGAIATAGEWGLKRGCAVAYTDKGTGTGAHNLQTNTVNLMRGERADAAAARDDSNFTRGSRPASARRSTQPRPTASPSSTRTRSTTRRRTGADNVLRSIKFAFDMLEREVRAPHLKFNKRNTIVIASSVSNGGGASVLAVEQDDEGPDRRRAVGEPNVNPNSRAASRSSRAAARRSRAQQSADGLHHAGQRVPELRQPCARERHRGAQPGGRARKRCADLKAKGLLTAATPHEQATEAQEIINDYGILPDRTWSSPATR